MGCITDPINAFKEMLGDNPHFQTWAGVANSSAAKARIYRDGLPSPDVSQDAFTASQLAALRPYALIYPDESEPFLMRRDASHNCWKTTGSLICVLSKSYVATSTPDAQFGELAAAIENIIRSDNIAQPGLVELAGEDNRLYLTDIRIDFVGRTPKEYLDDYGDAYDVLLSVRWG